MTYASSTGLTRMLPFALVAAIPALSTANADQLADVKDRGTISIGIKTDYRPFGFLDEAGEPVGFEVTLAKYIGADILGAEGQVELVPVVASNRIELLNAGRIDLILATLGVSEQRARVIDFTEAYYDMAGIVLMAPTNSELASWEDVSSVTLCGIQGNLYNRPLQETYGADLMLFPGTAEMFSAYEQGRCEAVAFDGPILQLKLTEPGWGEANKIAVDALEYIPIAGGVRKGEEAFLTAVNEAIMRAEAADVLVDSEAEFSMGESDYVSKRAEEARNAGY